MTTGDDIDLLLRDEGERWRARVPVPADVDPGRFGDAVPPRIPRKLIAGLSTAALAAVFVAVVGWQLRPAVTPNPKATGGAPAGQPTPPSLDPLGELPIVRPGDTVTATGAITTNQSGDTLLCPGLLVSTLPAGRPVDAGCFGGQMVLLTGVTDPPSAGTIIGTWNGEAVDVVEIEPAAPPEGPSLQTIPCDPPAGGWPELSVDDLGDAEARSEALSAEIAANPELYVGLWAARDGDLGGLDRVRALVVGTVDDIGEATDRLTAIYPFNLCVVGVEFSAADLEVVLDELEEIDADWLLDIQPETDRVHVSTVALDPVQADALRPYLDRIELNVTLNPVRREPSSTPAPTEGAEPILVCGRIGPEDCDKAVDIVWAAARQVVDDARAIVMDDSCPPSGEGLAIFCDRRWPFDAIVVVLPRDSNEGNSTFSVIGKEGPESIGLEMVSIPEHIHDLIATVSSPGQPAACSPEAFLEAVRVVIYDYEPFESPRKLAQASDLVVIGRIVEATAIPGERWTDTELVVEVRELLRGSLAIDAQVRVWVRGDAASSAAIEGIAGCDVVLFLSRTDAEASTYGPFAEGFWIDTDGGLEGVHAEPSWGVESIDDLREASGYSPAERDEAYSTVAGVVNRDTENFGGLYIDRDGFIETLVIQYVGDNAGRAAVEELITPAVNVRWIQVQRSRAELDRIMDEISEQRLPGVGLIGLDTTGNRIEVGVYPASSMNEVSELLSRYGEAVNVTGLEQLPIAG